MKSVNNSKPPYTLIAVSMILVPILAFAILYATDSARAQQQNPVVSIEQPWFYVDNSERPTLTVKLDKPADTLEPEVFAVIDLYVMVCDPVCHFEPAPHVSGRAVPWTQHYSFGTKKDGDAKTEIVDIYVSKDLIKDIWPLVVYPQKALIVTRLDETTAVNVTIADGHDKFRFPEIVVADSQTVTEGERSYIPVRLSSSTSDTVKVAYELVDETAVWNKDYVAKRSGVLTFGPDKEVAKIKFQTTDNDAFGKNKTFKVNLSSPADQPFSVVGGPTAVVTIENDDPMPTLTISGSTRYDTSTIYTYFDYEFQLSEPSEEPVTIEYELPLWNPGENKTPYGGLRINRDVKTFEIGANQTSVALQDIEARIGDAAYELGHRLSLEVTSVTNAIYGKLGEDLFAEERAAETAPTETATTTTPLPTLSLEPTWLVWEGGDRYLTYNLDSPSKHAVLLSILTSFYKLVCDPGCRFEKTKYYHSEGFRTLPGTTSGQIPWTGYYNPPYNEGIFVAEIKKIGGAEVSGDVNPGLPHFVTASHETTIPEGEISHITLRLDQPIETPVTVSYEFEDDSAVLGKHYTAEQSGTVTFKPGKRSAKIPYRATQNEFHSGETQFSVILSQSDKKDAVFLTADNKLTNSLTASIKIVDDDDDSPLPIIRQAHHQQKSGVAKYTFELHRPSDKTIKIVARYGVLPYEDSDSRDFEVQVTFQPGSTRAEVEVDMSGNYRRYIHDYPMEVSLENAVFQSGDALGYIYSTKPGEFVDLNNVNSISTIQNYLKPKKQGDTIKVLDASVTEGQVAEFEIVLSKPLSEDLTVTYIAREISETLGDDKTSLARMDVDFKRERRTVVIPAGSTSTLAYIWTLEDKRQESDERFVVEIVEMSKKGLTPLDGYITIEDNDSPPSMYIFSTNIIKQDGQKFVEVRLRLTTTSHQPVTETLEVFSNKSEDDTPVTTVPVTFAPGETRHILRFAVEDDDDEE